MILLNVTNGFEYNCRLYTARRNNAEKSLGGEWYDFLKDNELQEGDTLRFDLPHPPTVLFVDIERANNLA